MGKQFDAIIAFYNDKMGWPMEESPENAILSVTYQGKHGQWVFVASMDEANGTITLFTRFPESCPRDRFSVMSEFLEKANFGMTHGAWVMDRSDGEIRYRLGVDINGIQLTDELLQNMTLYTNLTMDTYWMGLKSILKQECSASEAFLQVFPR
jgi:hypothetical protein